MQKLLSTLLTAYFRTFRSSVEPFIRDNVDLAIQEIGRSDPAAAEHISRSITRVCRFHSVDFWDHDYLDH